MYLSICMAVPPFMVTWQVQRNAPEAEVQSLSCRFFFVPHTPRFPSFDQERILQIHHHEKSCSYDVLII